MGTTEEWPREIFLMTSTKTETQLYIQSARPAQAGGAAGKKTTIMQNAFLLALLLALCTMQNALWGLAT